MDTDAPAGVMGRGKGVSACEQDNSQTQTCADHGLGKVNWLQNDSHPEERGCIMHASSSRLLQRGAARKSWSKEI